VGALHEEMGIHFRFVWHFVDGVLAVQQIVSPRNVEQLSGSLCGKVGPLQGHRPVRWNRSGFQYLARADKWS
jgi:hypothetical protein